MRGAAAVALAVLLLLAPLAGATDDVRNPGFVNRILTVLESPQLAPGQSGVFRLNFTNPYAHRMENTSLNVSIYRYATIEESLPVDSAWAWNFPRIRESPTFPREYFVIPPIPPNSTRPPSSSEVLSFTVETSRDMPRGTVFAQAAYFLRFWLEFDLDNGTGMARYVIASKGYFTDAQWDEARTNLGPGCHPWNATNRCIGNLNLTRLGVDGLLPDSAFGVKEPIPIWPFYGLLVLTGFFLVLAFLFWVEENPGQYPRIERRWLTFKGRLRRLIRLPRLRRS